MTQYGNDYARTRLLGRLLLWQQQPMSSRGDLMVVLCDSLPGDASQNSYGSWWLNSERDASNDRTSSQTDAEGPNEGAEVTNTKAQMLPPLTPPFSVPTSQLRSPNSPSNEDRLSVSTLQESLVSFDAILACVYLVPHKLSSSRDILEYVYASMILYGDLYYVLTPL